VVYPGTLNASRSPVNDFHMLNDADIRESLDDTSLKKVGNSNSQQGAEAHGF